MSTPTPSPFSDEELSALLDGELDAARAAELSQDPSAQRRLDQVRSTAQWLSSTPVDPLEGDVVDDLVAAALDAPAAAPTPIRSRQRGPASWLAAAAIAVVFAVGVTLIIQGGSSNTDEMATIDAGTQESTDSADGGRSADDASDSESSRPGEEKMNSTESAAEAPQLTTTAPTAETNGDVGPLALGSFVSGDELRVALAEAFPSDADAASSSSTSAPTAEAVDRCGEQLRITLDLDAAPQKTGFAEVDDKAVLVYEFATDSFADGSPTTLVAAVGTEACEQVVLFER